MLHGVKSGDQVGSETSFPLPIHKIGIFFLTIVWLEMRGAAKPHPVFSLNIVWLKLCIVAEPHPVKNVDREGSLQA